MSDRPLPQPRDAYRRYARLTTRWMDNDVYGHLDNVVYYSLFATAVNGYLIGAGAQTQCNYFAPVEFPTPVEAGLRVEHVGRSSLRYRVGIFAEGQPHSAAAGHFVHVYVDRATRRPVPLPEPLRRALEVLL